MKAAAEQFGKACEEIGFAVISGHGVSEDEITPIMQVTRDFFHQDKQANIWPSPEFRQAWRAYFRSVKGVADYLLELAAIALDLPQDWFAPKFSRQSSYVLANYYPPQLTVPDGGSIRQHAHTDYGAFTVLYQENDKGGLEVEHRDGSYARVPAIPGTFIVNLGDMLANWTNGRWVATRHAVRNPEADEMGSERISIPFFQHPNLDAVIETIPTCLAPGELPKYEPIVWRDWGRRRMSMISHT